MGKYTSSAVTRKPHKTNAPHAIWRGIGCLMMLLIPAISIAAGVGTIDYGLEHNWAIPYELLGYPALPDWFYKSSGLMTIFGPVTRISNLYAYAATSILYMIMIGGMISVIYAFAYRIVGPERYGPQDMPPPRFKTKKYKR